MPATDVYAATCVFYQCITGHRPFEANTTEELRSLHSGAPVPLDAVPQALRPLIARGMAKDPGWRPSTADAFVTELETVARKAYGKGWEKRGWKRLAASAAALTSLTPLALLTAAGMSAAPVAAGTAAAGAGATTAGAGTGVTAAMAGNVAIAILVLGALVAAGLYVFARRDDPPALAMSMQTTSGVPSPEAVSAVTPSPTGLTDTTLRSVRRCWWRRPTSTTRHPTARRSQASAHPQRSRYRARRS
jgi:serine/threonine-protein kinase